MEFFCNEEHAKKWLAQRSDPDGPDGFLIDFTQSARICHIFYGGLRSEFDLET